MCFYCRLFHGNAWGLFAFWCVQLATFKSLRRSVSCVQFDIFRLPVPVRVFLGSNFSPCCCELFVFVCGAIHDGRLRFSGTAVHHSAWPKWFLIFSGWVVCICAKYFSKWIPVCKGQSPKMRCSVPKIHQNCRRRQVDSVLFCSWFSSFKIQKMRNIVIGGWKKEDEAWTSVEGAQGAKCIHMDSITGISKQNARRRSRRRSWRVVARSHAWLLFSTSRWGSARRLPSLQSHAAACWSWWLLLFERYLPMAWSLQSASFEFEMRCALDLSHAWTVKIQFLSCLIVEILWNAKVSRRRAGVKTNGAKIFTGQKRFHRWGTIRQNLNLSLNGGNPVSSN